jgi:hypothetical protein
MRRNLMKGLVIAIAIAGAGLDTATPRAAAGLTPMLEVHARTTKRDGGAFGTATIKAAFVPGTPVTTSVTAGSTRPEEMTLCGGGVGGDQPIADLLKRNSFVWRVTTIPIRQENGRLTFDLEWARYRADSPLRPAAQGTLTLTLPEGQRQIIDLAHGAPGTSGCNAESTLIEVGAAVREDPKLAATILQYDLWLTHDGTDGHKQVRHFAAMGIQGAEVAFAFVPLRFSIVERVPNQVAYDVFTSVLGTIRGRLQPGGRVDLTVDTTRRDGLGPRGEGPNGNSGNSGVKRLDVAPSEAVEIELPVAGGGSSLPAIAGVVPPPRRGPATPATEGVIVADGQVRVDNALFFQGQRTSLVVQVHEVR